MNFDDINLLLESPAVEVPMFSPQEERLRSEYIDIARQEVQFLQPKPGLYSMSVIDNGIPVRVQFTWEELKGIEYCRKFFERQNELHKRDTEVSSTATANAKEKYKEETGIDIDDVSDEPVIVGGETSVKVEPW